MFEKEFSAFSTATPEALSMATVAARAASAKFVRDRIRKSVRPKSNRVMLTVRPPPN